MKRIIAAMTAALLMVGVVSGGAIASPSTPSWKVYTFNSSGQAYSSKQATTFPTGTGFNFTAAPNTALLTTGDKSLTGTLTGKTLTATFMITGSAPVFTYYGEPGQCTTPASVRLYFTGTGEKSPGFYSNYWWSNPESSVLAVTASGTVTLTASLATTAWSNWNGQPGSAVPANFAAAVASVSSVGLSFGGGCFFANGVGVSSGTAQFVLTSYTVTS